MATVTRMPPGRSRPRAVAPAASPPIEASKPAPLTLEERLAILAKHPSGMLAEQYLEIRDAKRALESQAAELERKLEVLELALLDKLKKDRTDGFTARGYVLYKRTQTTASVADKKELTDFILADPESRLELLELRASITGARNYMDLHPVTDAEGKVVTPPPPGVNLTDMVKIGVRKK